MSLIIYIASTGTNSAAYGPGNADLVYVDALTNNVVFTINATLGGGLIASTVTPQIRFVNKDTSHTLQVADPSAGAVITLQNLSGHAWSALLVLVNGIYTPISFDVVP